MEWSMGPLAMYDNNMTRIDIDMLLYEDYEDSDVFGLDLQEMKRYLQNSNRWRPRNKH